MAILAAIPLFAGGGGGDYSGWSDDNEVPGANPIVCIIIFLTTGDTGCAELGFRTLVTRE